MDKLFFIRQHTRKLLQFDVFEYRPDEIISRIHHIVMLPSIGESDARFLLSQWRQGSYCNSFTAMQALQETNQLLSSLGFPIIEEDFLECIID